MGIRWYESRTVQGAIIGAIAIIAATSIATFGKRDPGMSIVEVKNLTPTGDEVLARLALSPTQQLVDSAVFSSLANRDLLWNDSLGVAIGKPIGYEWGVSQADSIDEISVNDVALVHYFAGFTKKGFGDAVPKRIRFFGVRLDKPSLITITKATTLDSVAVTGNPFRDAKYFVRFLGMMLSPAEIRAMPLDSLRDIQREAIGEVDSVANSYIPSARRILNGVFVARVSERDTRDPFLGDWLRQPILDQVARLLGVSVGSPTLLMIDRDRGTLVFSDAVRIEGAELDGRPAKSVTLNRAGYAIKSGNSVFVVMLQFVSNQPKEVLAELQKLLASVRIRTA